MSTERTYLSLTDRLSLIPDTRINRTKKHKLLDILFITICAVLCGADDYMMIGSFGRAKIDWFKERLELKNGIPSHDTFRRVLSLLEPDELSKMFTLWVEDIKAQCVAQAVASATVTGTQTMPDCIAIDGKMIRHSFDTAHGTKAIHMLSAWSSKFRLVIGQEKVDDKSNEITAIPELLRKLDITGCLITIDAMGCQKSIAKLIEEQGGTYILALKSNHPHLSEDAVLYLEHAKKQKFDGYSVQERLTLDKGHGRIENRKYTLLELPEGIAWEDIKEKWPGLKSIGVAEATREMNGKTSVETRYFLTGLPAKRKSDIIKFSKAVRNHWKIENSLHWCLDMSFKEDASRVRTDHAPENLARIRHIVLNILRQDKEAKVGIKTRRLKAGWDTNYMEYLLTN